MQATDPGQFPTLGPRPKLMRQVVLLAEGSELRNCAGPIPVLVGQHDLQEGPQSLGRNVDPILIIVAAKCVLRRLPNIVPGQPDAALSAFIQRDGYAGRWGPVFKQDHGFILLGWAVMRPSDRCLVRATSQLRKGWNCHLFAQGGPEDEDRRISRPKTLRGPSFLPSALAA